MEDMIERGKRLLEKMGSSELHKGVTAAPPDDELAGDCPCVHALLTCPVGPEGRPRRTASLLVFFEDGVWKGVLHDREMGRQLWVTSRWYVDLVVALEERLTADPIDWRRARQWAREGARKG